MKKILMTLVTLAAVVCLFATTALAAGTTAYISAGGGNVNMRQGPGTKFKIITVLPHGTQLTIETPDDGSGWAYVKTSDNVGWVSTKYIAMTLETASTQYTSYRGDAVEATLNSNSNLRSGPGMSHSVLTVVPKGFTVKVDSYADGWAHVVWGDTEGYIATRLIDGLPAANITSASTTSSSTPNGSTWYGGYNYANVYDYNYYRNNNADLRKAFGNNADAYLQHFVNYGMDEGRQAISSFNVYTYRDEHPDLETKFGDTLRCYYLWACGIPF